MNRDELVDALMAAWEQAVFQHLGAKLLPAAYDENTGRLVIGCDSNTSLTYGRLMGAALLQKLNDALPTPHIRTIAFRLRDIRILVTGSRRWPDYQAVADTLNDVWHDATQEHFGHRLVIVHGDCPTGADAMAKRWALENEITHEPHPADWSAKCGIDCVPEGHRKTSSRFGDYCPLAGPIRNQRMADRGADLCVAFLIQGSKGTADCLSRVRAAGIPIHTGFRSEPFDA